MASPAPTRFRIRDFDLDAATGELRKNGSLVKLQPQPFRVLLLLVEHAGQLVTREEIQRCLWKDSTFVDFEHGINFSINQIRAALQDDAEKPRYVETLPRRGYRFIGTVVPTNGEASAAESEAPEAANNKTQTTSRLLPSTNFSRYAVALGGVAMLAVLVFMATGSLRHHPSPPIAVPTIGSLAVLPLVNLSGEAAQDYFVDGMTDAVITDLGQVESLRVISRTSSMRYKGTNKSFQEIARDLTVDALVEGTVTRAGDRVRITASLIQASPEKHLWAQTYERDMRDVLALQDEIAHDIAREIRVQLTPAEQARLGNSRQVDPEAYQLYLRGRYFLGKGYPADFQKSGPYLDQAIAKDPSYAPAYAGLATFWIAYLDWSKAEVAAERAIELDNALAEAHAAIAEIRLYRDWNWLAAQEEFKRALDLNPNSVEVLTSYVEYLRFAGRLEEAVREAKRTIEIDPVGLFPNNLLGITLFFARKDDDAIRQFRRSLELDANSTQAHFWLAAAYEAKGMYDDYVAEYAKFLNLRDEKHVAAEFQRIYKVHGYHAASRFSDQQDVLNSSKPPRDTWNLACGYARLGDAGSAFKWLQEAYQERHPGLLQIRIDPDMDGLRSDPRYADLVRRIGFPGP